MDSTLGRLPAGAHPVEAAVYHAARKAEPTGGDSVAELAAESSALADIRGRARRPGPALRRRRAGPPPGPVAVVRAAAGGRRRPGRGRVATGNARSGSWSALLLVTVGVVWFVSRRRHPPRTRTAHRLLADLRRRHPELPAREMPAAGASVGLALALAGVGVLASTDPALALAVGSEARGRVRRPPVVGWRWDGCGYAAAGTAAVRRRWWRRWWGAAAVAAAAAEGGAADERRRSGSGWGWAGAVRWRRWPCGGPTSGSWRWWRRPFPADPPDPAAAGGAPAAGRAGHPSRGAPVARERRARPTPTRLAALAHLAERVDAPLVSEHIAFVRGGRSGGRATSCPSPGPGPCSRCWWPTSSVAVARLPVPLALEPIAALVEWPDAEIDEGAFVTELLERTGALLLLDVANLYANARNHGYEPVALLDRLPLDRLAYVHVAGGSRARAGSTTTPTPTRCRTGVLDLLGHLAARAPIPGAMLERDSSLPAHRRGGVGARRHRRRAGRRADDVDATTTTAAGPSLSLVHRVAGPATATATGSPPSRRRWSAPWWAAGAPAAGFDRDRLDAAAAVLAAKRAAEGARRPARRRRRRRAR